MLEARGLKKKITHRTLLESVSFQIPEGEVLAVMGPNGAGKSTLLKILAGLMKVSEGKVTWRGKEIEKDTSTGQPLIGMLSHQTFLYNSLTGRENLYFYSSLTGQKVTPSHLDDILYRVGLEWDGEEEVGNYSRGMQQRLAMARLLVQNPGLILLDEPQTGLDQAGIKLLCELMGQWKKEGKSMIMVTHSCDELFTLVDQLLILEKGYSVYIGECPNSPTEVLNLYKKSLRGVNDTCSEN